MQFNESFINTEWGWLQHKFERMHFQLKFVEPSEKKVQNDLELFTGQLSVKPENSDQRMSMRMERIKQTLRDQDELPEHSD